jgi:3-dehydroquinate dehydratase-2
MKKLLIINGPNLNFLGIRQPEIYGGQTLEEINALADERAAHCGFTAEFFQSNWEGAIIDKIQDAYGKMDALIINPGAFTHYSYAIADAIAALNMPVIEVHLSNIQQREEFRHHSVIAPYCHKQITGYGVNSYIMAIDHLAEHIGNSAL